MALSAVKGAPGIRERFPQSLRLRRREEFLRIQRQGIKVSTDPLLALALRNSGAVTRLGVTVSTKVGNAVVRNQAEEAFLATVVVFLPAAPIRFYRWLIARILPSRCRFYPSRSAYALQAI